MRIAFNDFKERIASIQFAVSITGRATYVQHEIKGDRIQITRNNSGKPCTFSLTALYKIYTTSDVINSKIISNFITNKTYAPACALLIASGLYDTNGVRT